MRLLWVKTDFLHPTTRGGQIRTLEMLRRLHLRHDVSYVAFENPAQPEGVRRAGEYSTRAYPVPHRITSKTSPKFAIDLATALFSELPLAVSRYRSAAMRRQIGELLATERFDAVVCDFLAPAPNLADWSHAVLFQHNIETLIWRRHAQHASGPRHLYFQLQAERMFRYEAEVSRSARHVITVSEADARVTRELFGVSASFVPTGVDVEFFASRSAAPAFDLVFVGSMDWMPNLDGVRYFVSEILPRLHARRPELKVGIVGRDPAPEIIEMGRRNSRITVTGTVEDVRPYLWGSAVSIVPLRIGGGTRLKIYESMAAGTAVVSTTVGAEGLDVRHPETIRLADSPEEFAAQCLELLENSEERARQARSARELVAEQFSWEAVAQSFEKILACCSETRVAAR